MASESSHLDWANRTQQTISHLLQRPRVNSPWIAIAAFYKALHLVEATFANDPAIGHTADHGSRAEWLKKARRYVQIYKHYHPLQDASYVARYLTRPFDEYLSPDEVVAILLKHHLVQLEKSAVKFLSQPERLQRIAVVFDQIQPP